MVRCLTDKSFHLNSSNLYLLLKKFHINTEYIRHAVERTLTSSTYSPVRTLRPYGIAEGGRMFDNCSEENRGNDCDPFGRVEKFVNRMLSEQNKQL